MVCGNCGKQLKDGAKFCDGCGMAVNPSAAGAAEQSVAADEPVILGKGKRRGVGLMVGGGVAVVALALAAVVLLGGLLGGARGKVAKAAVKSAGAYAEVLDIFGVSTVGNLLEKQAFTQTVSFELEEVSEDMAYYNDIVAGLGMEFVVATDLPGHHLSSSGALRWGSADLMGVYLEMDEGKIVVYSPELLDDTALGINTETIGKDLSENDWLEDYLYEDLSDFEELSFNIFDLIDLVREVKPMDTAAQKELLKAIEVEKEGSDEIEVNDEDVKCTIYSVVIPEDALMDYLDAVKDYVEESSNTDAVEDYLDSLELDIDVEDFSGEMDSAYDEMFTAMEELIETLGDLEFEVAVKGGYIMAVNGEVEEFEYSLQLGGGKKYVNDISLTLEADGTEIVIKSTGDHVPEGGVFTDTTSITVTNGGYEEEVAFETEYDTRAKEDNFTFDTDIEGMILSLEGTLNVGSGFSLLIDELVYDDGYGESLTLSGEYSIQPFSKVKIPAKETIMILSMDEDDMMDLAEDFVENAEDWGEDFYDNYYDLYSAMQYWF